MKFGVKNKYTNIFLLVIVSYVGIKLIDNCGVILNGVNKFLGILTPFIIAFIIAYALSSVVALIQRKLKTNRGASVLITYILLILIIIFFVRGFIPIIIKSVEDIVRSIPIFSNKAQEWLNYRIQSNEALAIFNKSNFLEKTMSSYLPKVGDVLTVFGNAILNNTIAFTTSLVNVVFGLIIAIYILIDKEKFIIFGKKIIYALLKRKNGDAFLHFIKNLNNTFSIYIGAKALDSAIIGVIAFIGISILKSQYSALIALIYGITNMIPYFGPFIGMTVAVIINLFFNPMRALWILIFLLLLQQFDGWFLDPKLTGNKVGISPFLTILAVIIGGGLFGIWGMLLGVPVMAIIKIYVDEYLRKYDLD